MHRAVLWQGLPWSAGEQDKARIKQIKLFWSLRCLLVGSRPCCQLPDKKQEGRRARTDRGSCPHPCPFHLYPARTTLRSPRSTGTCPWSCSRCLEKAHAVPRRGQNTWCSWRSPSSPGTGQPGVTPGTEGTRLCCGSEWGWSPACSSWWYAEEEGGRLAESWDTQCTSQCPTSPGAAGSPGSEREMGAPDMPTARQRHTLQKYRRRGAPHLSKQQHLPVRIESPELLERGVAVAGGPGPRSAAAGPLLCSGRHCPPWHGHGSKRRVNSTPRPSPVGAFLAGLGLLLHCPFPRRLHSVGCFTRQGTSWRAGTTPLDL